jgi:UDP-3-O-[3-hydroxymyristoyl] glucosamine N-acyltransferase
MTLTTAEIAKLLAGEVLGDANATLTGFANADSAKPGDLTFAETEEFFLAAENSAATAIIAGKNSSSAKKTVIRVDNPRLAFAKALAVFFPEPKFIAGIHPSAAIAASAQIDPTAHIGPHCTVGERVKIGANAVLQSGNFIGDDAVIGDETNLFSNVTIYPRT